VSWFRNKSSAATTPDYTGLQLQTSVNTLPVTMVWGQTKIAPNVIWYSNFQIDQGKSGKGGLFSGGATGQTTYSADLIMALCEGPISGIGQIWKDQSVYTLASLGLTFFNGATPQAPWGYIASADPNQALAYQGTAYVCAASYALGASADISNHNFEIDGIFAGSGVNGIDADPALVINDFLTNPQYGLGFNPASIATSTLFGSGGDSSLQTYCRAMGIAFSPALTDQEQASSILQRWLQICNCAAVWSGGQLKFVPYGDSAIAAGTLVPMSVVLPIEAPATSASGTTPPPTIVVCPPGQFSADGGVIYDFTGGALTHTGAAAAGAGTYGISPEGTYIFSTADESQVVKISFTYAIPASFVAPVTPIYSLGDDDFVGEEGGKDPKDPVTVSRVDPFSLSTIQRLEVLDRNNQYATTPIEARDQSQIELYGPRVGTAITAHEICDIAIVAPIVAQTILQRGLYVRANFKFKLSWEYGLLDPMDVVEISDANLGLSNYPVRILAIEEDDKGLLTVTAEELVAGVSTPVLYPTHSATSNIPDFGAAPGNVNPPILIEPPDQISQGLNLYMGLSGADPATWGGCHVWASTDGTSYQQQPGAAGASRMGVLTAALPAIAAAAAGASIDATNVLAVSLAESGGELAGGSGADLAALATLCVVDQEALAYQNATLTGAEAYSLTPLSRGAYGSAIAAHAAGAPFLRLDGEPYVLPFTAAQIGQTVYFKFTSFNIVGACEQSLADVAPYAYAFTGAALTGALAAPTALFTNFANGFEQIWFTPVSDPRAPIFYEMRSGASAANGAVVATQAHPPFTAPGAGTYWIAAKVTPATGITIYSAWQSITISANQLAQNTLQRFDDQAAGWTGTLGAGLGVQGTGATNYLRLTGAGNILTTNPVLVSAAATAAAASGSVIMVLPVAAGIAAGMSVSDLTTPSAIPANKTVVGVALTILDCGAVASAATLSQDIGAVSSAATTTLDLGGVNDALAITLSGPVASGGVLASDTIVFSLADVLTAGGIPTATPAYYQSAETISVGYLGQVSINATIAYAGVPIGANFLADANVLTDPDVLNSASTAYVSAWIEIRLSPDGVTWGAWQRFMVGVFSCFEAQLRVGALSNDPNTYAIVSAFNQTAQLPTRVDHYANLSVPSTGLTVVFQPDYATSPGAFNAGPARATLPYAIVAANTLQAGDSAVVSGESLSQLTLTIFNGGSAVARAGVALTVEGF